MLIDLLFNRSRFIVLEKSETTSDLVEKSTPSGNEIAVKCEEVNPDEGKEFLFTDLKISLYK